MAEKELVSHSVTYQTANENDEGQRLDNYLARNLKGVPRSMIYRILRRGEVRVNKGRVSPSYKLKEGDVIRIPPVTVTEGPVTIPSSNLHLVQDLRNRILFENEDLLVVDKPAGLAAHGGSGIEFGLIEDLIVAKRRSALRHLHEQFRQRIVKKRYITLVPGKWDRRVQLVDAPLIRNELRSGERMVEVNFKKGAPSSTGFDVIEFLDGATLMAAMPHTGRTHQIRVHCAYVKHPVGGDDKYGDKEFNERLKSLGLKRMFLHAAKVTFLNPKDNSVLKIEGPMPEEFEQALKLLRIKKS